MWPDAKWLEIIKATGPQALAISIATGIFLFLEVTDVFGVLDLWVRPAVTFIFLLSSCLALVAFVKTIGVDKSISIWRKRRANKEAVRRYIPHMTSKEKEIIGYLLSRNQKVFVAATDGGYANTLIARGIVMIALRPGQVFEDDHIPMCIPDDVWEVLLELRDNFPMGDPNKNEPHPWRVPWMAR